jgi:uncharacterized protein YgiB involved in biofilm formation
MSKYRRSRRIVLVLIGAATLPACTPDSQRAVHDRYASLEDCSADWGRPGVCDREENHSPLAGNFGGPRILYRGPDYPAGERWGAQSQAIDQARLVGALDQHALAPGNRAIEAAVPTRGGFGSSAHSFGRLG